MTYLVNGSRVVRSLAWIEEQLLVAIDRVRRALDSRRNQ
jgi:hypothetical protein